MNILNSTPEQAVNELEDYIRKTNPVYKIREFFGHAEFVFVSGVELQDNLNDFAQRLADILLQVHITHTFRDHIYRETIDSYLESSDLECILRPFKELDYALFDYEKASELEKEYLTEISRSLIAKCCFSDSTYVELDEQNQARFIVDWVKQYTNFYVHLRNDQQLIAIQEILSNLL